MVIQMFPTLGKPQGAPVRACPSIVLGTVMVWPCCQALDTLPRTSQAADPQVPPARPGPPDLEMGGNGQPTTFGYHQPLQLCKRLALPLGAMTIGHWRVSCGSEYCLNKTHAIGV